MRLLVCGGRNYDDRVRVFRELDALEINEGVDLVIHGGATGADALASEWAISRCIPERWFAAEWKRFGRPAGPMRNQRMLDEGKPHLVLAFPGGPGTADMVNRAIIAGVEIRRVEGPA